MKLSNRQSGVLDFIQRTLATVARQGSIRVVCKNQNVATALTKAAVARRIFVVGDGCKLTLAKGK